MTPVDTDQLLVDMFKEGNEKALELIFVKYYATLCNYTAFIVKNDSIAEEIVSDVFVNLWHKRKELLISISLKAYLYASARNAALNAIRKKKIKFTALSKSLQASHSTQVTPYEQIKEQELAEGLHQIIERLPKQRRRIFLLNWKEGLHISQIAIELNVSESTVKNQLQSAYRFVKAQLPYLFSLSTLGLGYLGQLSYLYERFLYDLLTIT
ncbi:RNA polymerase sigma-70 factor [Cytophagaceae bacterium DM2B3-1]|uniref:RNA polymerase sigma-70 factor n=1 Tax=Xanthocytophaga flava TaxID=3048013 RepID=A0ABT7CHJ8_9BACT|nr:RNA polymerase sigma-70 factor [Xanthocytophaga flavus]MDJ1470764.1 RNA polymerase sigma-70 factor [Xanthocytophaga flavus]MDJ1493163.1 RNA polymerase sigma-70 factor [Xanthocytophaga flavus]